MIEEWRPVEEFPGYLVSNTGVIVRKNSRRPIRPSVVGSRGALQVCFSDRGRKQTRLVHRVVAEAFLTGFRHHRQIYHLDGDPTNNHVLNLRFHHNEGVGQYISGEQGSRMRFVYLENTGELFRTVREAAEAIGGSTSGVYNVLRGVRKSYLGWVFSWRYEEGALDEGSIRTASSRRLESPGEW